MKPGEPLAVVTGMGAVSSLGLNLNACMDNMFTAPPVPAPPRRFSTDHDVAYPVFSLPGLPNSNCSNFDPADFYLADFNLKKRERDLSLTAQMAIVAAREALADAGLNRESLKGKIVGVCMGTTVGAALNNDSFYAQYRQRKRPGMEPVIRFLSSNPAQAVASALDLNGPVQTVVNACASGADAVGVGAGWIRSGICDVVIAGGTDELCKVTYNGFTSLMITDSEPCRPFDAGRRGLNLGEGAAALVLEPYNGHSSPLRERIRAGITGYGSACDAYHLTAPRPDAKGICSALEIALAQGGIDRADLGFVNAHGTGTRENDRMEMTVFQNQLPGIPFFSTKGYTGHTLGAAGALEAALTIASLNMGKIPGSRGFSTPDPDFTVTPVACAKTINASTAISQSVAFGGNNVVLVFKQP